MYTVKFETLGCRLNQTESEAIARVFSDAGFNISNESSPENVILVIFNTCTVTSKAEQKARRIIRQSLKKYENAVMLVTGCYAQLAGKEIESIDSRIICFPGQEKDLLIELPTEMAKIDNPHSDKILNTIINFKKNIQSQPQFKLPTEKRRFKLSTDTFSFHSRAGLKVQDGCNNACTFCRVHIARGKSVSLDLNDVIERARQIESTGATEIVLTGVNLSQYYSQEKTFPDLLRIILDATKNIRLRISSIYPELVNSNFLDVITNPRICPHFHLSIQSGSPKILKSMKRPHNIDKTLEAIHNIRKAKNNPFLGCDIITGFPGESEDDFEQTLDLCKKAFFTGIHAFPFSPRPDTEAFNMQPKIPERISHERVKILNNLATEHYKLYLESCNDRIVFGTVEYSSKPTEQKLLTENYLLLPIKTEKSQKPLSKGMELKVKIKNGYAIPV